MVGQGYDGAAVVSGDINGVQRHVLEKGLSALLHSLHISVSQSMLSQSLPHPRSTISSYLYESDCTVLKNSSKILLVLQDKICELRPSSSLNRIKDYRTAKHVDWRNSRQA